MNEYLKKKMVMVIIKWSWLVDIRHGCRKKRTINSYWFPFHQKKKKVQEKWNQNESGTRIIVKYLCADVKRKVEDRKQVGRVHYVQSDTS